MKIKALEYFIVLAESHSINEAAQKLYIAQPSLTKALQLFEKEIGVQLFLRTQSGITLTEAGEKILSEAKQMVEYYNGWLALSEQNLPQSVGVYAHTSLSGFLLSDVILQLKARHPDLTVNYTTTMNPAAYVSRDAHKPSIALSICSEGKEYQDLVELWKNSPQALFRGEYRCLVNREDPLAQKSAVTMDDLKDYYFFAPDLKGMGAGCAMPPILYDIIKATSPDKMIKLESAANVVNLLENHPGGFVLAYYPACNRYAGVVKKKLVHIPFKDCNAKGNLCLFYSNWAYKQYPVIQELVETIRDAFKQFLSDSGVCTLLE